MKYRGTAWSMTALFIILCAAFVACRKDDTQDSDPALVAVSIPPLAGIVDRIAGDRAKVLTMVPPGASPHTYEPTPNQMALLSTADLYVKVGTPIEFERIWLDRMLTMNSAMQVCNASQGIALIPTHGDDDHDAVDPHVWLSLRNTRVMIDNISRALASVDPQHASTYLKNATDFSTRVDSLDRMIADMLSIVKTRLFISYHSSWIYFARDYDLEQKAIETGGKEPSAKTIRDIIETARRSDIRVLFASPQFDRKYAHMIARDIGGQVILIDPLSEHSIETITTFASTLAQYME